MTGGELESSSIEEPATEVPVTETPASAASSTAPSTRETAPPAAADTATSTAKPEAVVPATAATAVRRAPPRTALVDGRPADLALAGVHLRLGSLALARAELETLAGIDALDEDGLVDLAEVRWRTGDLTGAGEAAEAALQDGKGPLVALVIAAEASAQRGRPTDARKLATAALGLVDGSIDDIFAGMPRAAVWPADPAAPPPSPTTMFHPLGSQRSAGAGPSTDAAAAAAIALGGGPVATGQPVAPATGLAAGPLIAMDATAPGLWDLGPADPATEGDIPAMPDVEAELDEGRAALEAGDLAGAGLHLSLVLRVAPALAPAVLDLVRDRSEPVLALVRGDAFRLVGRELDARRAFSDAARRPTPSLAASTPTQTTSNDPTTPPQGDPA